ncbi:excinuclease ABC subunit UvrA [Clostridium sp. 'deep sea']|uniref:excinuclease ABC subunit UvrA n=1 Tax=Clostridium sp. 'deep sea' TaxID=2779445 RepID=UPI0018965FD5|nr:excinuclease ABC subunit UvrA [Clostridium sp. 'deep sea']QOR34817.1 excinuclease ABC subunit UvrA [Clostridium sp. 'deep sea']
MKINRNDLNYYVQQSVITDPKQYEKELDALPENPEQLLNIVQGLVIHGALGKLYGFKFSKKQSDEELLRTVPQMLEVIFRLDHRSLKEAREPKQRLVGMCRDYALLLISFMRHKKIPARLRVGFANYFDSEVMYEDHWVVEYYDIKQNRWIRVDAQIDEVQRKYYNITFNTSDMGANRNFLLGGEAWIKSRLGKHHPEDFGYNKNWKGWFSVKGNLLHDLNCLQGFELLPWDLWTELSTKKFSQLSQSEKQFLDEMADLTSNCNASTDDFKNLFARLPNEYLQSIRSKLVVLDVISRSNMIAPNSLSDKIEIEDVEKQQKYITSDVKLTTANQILLRGGRQNNLKDINVDIPKSKLTVVTGVSGSGKSSLAFDTIYAEGKRRYLDNLSSAARMQDQTEKPEFDSLQGLTPTIAIEQKKGSQNPRSTVGTLTSILDYLRMLYVAIGISHCPYCGKPLVKKNKNKNICSNCNLLFPSLTTSSFNPNTHSGACHECNGIGFKYEINPDAIIINDELSVLDGATHWWGVLRGKKLTGNWCVGELYAVAEYMKVDLNLPWKNMPQDFKKAILYGTGDKIHNFTYNSRGRETVISRPASGAFSHILRLFRESKSANNTYKQYMKEIPCTTCKQELLCTEARYTTILGWRLPELTKMPIAQLYNWFTTMVNNLPETQKEKTKDIFPEIKNRITNLIQVGLSYLTLDRTAPSLSGGELQRVRLSCQLGSDLVGLTYILDEPSIGLHPRDHHLMIDTIKKLRDKGNTVIVVEHDKDTMLVADYIIDVGPGAGIHGGEIVAAGTVNDIINNPLSLTGKYLKNDKLQPLPELQKPEKWLTLSGCTANNLKNITIDFPLHKMCCTTGVSGSGKSTLVFDTLIPALDEAINKKRLINRNFEQLKCFEEIDGFVHMDQSPIGKSTRSTPVTYIGAFNEIRKVFASLQDSKKLGLTEKHFSFNSKEGQCATCEGHGQIKVAFQYMADYYVTCPDCKGRRYKNQVLQITYKNKNIADILNMDVSQATIFWKDKAEIYNKLLVLEEVGLSYIKLGQNTTTLSGGESQRLKLAKELSRRQKKHMLYILDEPSTGLHFNDIEKLITIFKKLVSSNHTVLIIEHNTDIIRESDWIIEIGPEGGNHGGTVVATGTPNNLRNNSRSITGKYI